MKRLTLVALATLISAGSVVAFSSSVKAESREEYCRHHDCRGDYRGDYRRDYRGDYRRDDRRDRYEGHRPGDRWYDYRTREWRWRN